MAANPATFIQVYWCDTRDEILERLDRTHRGRGGRDPHPRLVLLPTAGTVDVASRVDHAIALFRRRDSGPEDKRSAIVVLAGILEQRRQLIKNTSLLTKKDENMLFDIVNNFALRHQNLNQQGDYDPAFLDWIF